MKSKRILVAEDMEEIRFKIGDDLEALGYSVELACDGADALRKYLTFKPDLLISDIGMPHVDGLLLLDIIRKLEPQIPFFIFSGSTGDPQTVGKLQAATMVIDKNFGALQILLQHVQNTFNRK